MREAGYTAIHGPVRRACVGVDRCSPGVVIVTRGPKSRPSPRAESLRGRLAQRTTSWSAAEPDRSSKNDHHDPPALGHLSCRQEEGVIRVDMYPMDSCGITLPSYCRPEDTISTSRSLRTICSGAGLQLASAVPSSIQTRNVDGPLRRSLSCPYTVNQIRLKLGNRLPTGHNVIGGCGISPQPTSPFLQPSTAATAIVRSSADDARSVRRLAR
jgi:hypothetical protein